MSAGSCGVKSKWSARSCRRRTCAAPPGPRSHLHIDEAGESIRLRPLDTCRSPVTGRYGKLHDLLHARAIPQNELLPLVRSCRPDARDGPSDKVPRSKYLRPPCHQKGPKRQSFTLPAARLSRHFRGKLLHRRSQKRRDKSGGERNDRGARPTSGTSREETSLPSPAASLRRGLMVAAGSSPPLAP